MKTGIKISLYGTVRSDQPTEVDLLEMIGLMNNEKQKTDYENLRLLYTTNPDEYKRRKSNLPAFTPSGTFSGKVASSLTAYSGYICIDIDGHDNPHITNYARLRDELAKIRNIDYCSLSASGQGVFCMVRLTDDHRNHKQHFNALMLCFKHLGINIDPKCDNINRLRFASYDPDCYLDKSDPVPFTQLLEQKPSDKKESILTPLTNNPYKPLTNQHQDTLSRVEAVIAKIEEQSIDITGEYGDWINLGMALAHEFSEEGRELFHSISRFHSKYKEQETNNVFDRFLNSTPPDRPITIGTFFFIAKEHGL